MSRTRESLLRSTVSHFVIFGTKGKAFSALSSNPFHTWSRLRTGMSGSFLSLTGTDRVMVNMVLPPFNSDNSTEKYEVCKSIRSSRVSERNDIAEHYFRVASTSSLFLTSPTPRFPQPCDRLVAKTLVVFFHN